MTDLLRCRCGDLPVQHRVRPKDGKLTTCKMPGCKCNCYRPLESARVGTTLAGNDAKLWNMWAATMRAIVFEQTGESVTGAVLLRLYLKGTLPVQVRRLNQADKSEL